MTRDWLSESWTPSLLLIATMTRFLQPPNKGLAQVHIIYSAGHPHCPSPSPNSPSCSWCLLLFSLTSILKFFKCIVDSSSPFSTWSQQPYMFFSHAKIMAKGKYVPDGCVPLPGTVFTGMVVFYVCTAYSAYVILKYINNASQHSSHTLSVYPTYLVWSFAITINCV